MVHLLVLADDDGKPTQWGRWHPEYVRRSPRQVGDRRVNSADIIAFLQTVYHFTGKDLYRQKAFALLHAHGYLDHITIPMRGLGRVAGIDLTTESNHSADEPAFLTCWNPYRYAFTELLRERHRQAFKDRREIVKGGVHPDGRMEIETLGTTPLLAAVWAIRAIPVRVLPSECPRHGPRDSQKSCEYSKSTRGPKSLSYTELNSKHSLCRILRKEGRSNPTLSVRSVG